MRSSETRVRTNENKEGDGYVLLIKYMDVMNIVQIS